MYCSLFTEGCVIAPPRLSSVAYLSLHSSHGPLETPLPHATSVLHSYRPFTTCHYVQSACCNPLPHFIVFVSVWTFTSYHDRHLFPLCTFMLALTMCSLLACSLRGSASSMPCEHCSCQSHCYCKDYVSYHLTSNGTTEVLWVVSVLNTAPWRHVVQWVV